MNAKIFFLLALVYSSTLLAAQQQYHCEFTPAQTFFEYKQSLDVYFYDGQFNSVNGKSFAAFGESRLYPEFNIEIPTAVNKDHVFTARSDYGGETAYKLTVYELDPKDQTIPKVEMRKALFELPGTREFPTYRQFPMTCVSSKTVPVKKMGTKSTKEMDRNLLKYLKHIDQPTSNSDLCYNTGDSFSDVMNEIKNLITSEEVDCALSNEYAEDYLCTVKLKTNQTDRPVYTFRFFYQPATTYLIDSTMDCFRTDY